MADRIIINYGKFNDHANGIDEQNKKMRATLNEIQNKIQSLEGDYVSNAAENVQVKIKKMSSRFDSYEQVVNNYVKFIRNAATQASNLEKVIVNNADQTLGVGGINDSQFKTQ